MKRRADLSFWGLIALLSASLFALFVSALEPAAFAGKSELDEVRSAILERNSRWEAGHTHVSALPVEARKRRLGSQFPIPVSTTKILAPSGAALPLHLDWRNYSGAGYVTPVKDQGDCNACWAFAPTAALESHVMISQNAPGRDLDLSEQALISCGLSGSCEGGLIDSAADFIRIVGLPAESCYPYCAAEGLCAEACSGAQEDAYRITGW